MKGLRGKKALVTGGGSGIGQAIAIRLGQEGVDVAINYVGPPEGAEETREAIEHGVQMCMKQMSDGGTRPILVAADVSDSGQVQRMFGEVHDQHGGIDILVNNAGIQIAGGSHDLDVAAFDKALAVNLRGAFMCAQQAIRGFIGDRGQGCTVNVSSVHQVIPKPRFVGYSASKGGMQNLTHTLALEYASRGIRVNGIGPGATVTPINRSWIDDPVKRAMVESHPDGGGPAGRTGWRRPPHSCAPTRPPTSPARRSSSTVGRRSTRASRPRGRRNEHVYGMLPLFPTPRPAL